MEKPCSSKGNRLNNYCTNLPQNKPENQSSNDSRLSHYIKNQRLTDSLELLENLGYYDEVAVFVLGTFQAFGGVA